MRRRGRRAILRPNMYNIGYFGDHPRMAMKILLHMVLMRSKRKGLFNSDDLGEVVSLSGREISGVLSSFAKRGGTPLIIKAGTIDVDWEGKSFNRPKQLWMLNPKLSKDDLKQIDTSLEQLLAVEGWCPLCGYTSTDNWNGCEVIERKHPVNCPKCGGGLVEERRNKKRLRA